MYSRSHRQAKTGKVGIRNSNERLRLVFTHEGKRHFVSLGLSNTPVNQVLAQEKAFQIQRDIEYSEFDPTYKKYKVQPALKIVEAAPEPQDSTPELGALWAKYNVTVNQNASRFHGFGCCGTQLGCRFSDRPGNPAIWIPMLSKHGSDVWLNESLTVK
jgi:Arm DNA-binding domain